MPELDSFSPAHLVDEAKISGLFQCQKCGLIWFGRPEFSDHCPQGPHGKPAHVALLCRDCDAIVTIDAITSHLSSEEHILCSS
jgi:hypothetical protein